MKNSKDQSELKVFKTEFDDFYEDFDLDMDYLANKAGYLEL